MRNVRQQSEPLAVTLREAARLASVCERTLTNARRAGRLRSVKVGVGPKSKVLIPMQALREYLGITDNRPTAQA